MMKKLRCHVDAVVPLKSRHTNKSRLRVGLGPMACAGLATAMARDVVAALHASSAVDQVFLVGAGLGVRALARRLRCGVLPERKRMVRPDSDEGARRDQDLNNAVVNGLQSLRARGARSVLVVHADLPYLTAAAIDEVLRLHRGVSAAVTIAADRRRAGTSLMALRPSNVIPPDFGAASASRHAKAAEDHGVRVRVVELGLSARDIDTPEDWRGLKAVHGLADAGKRTRRWVDTRRAMSPADALSALQNDPLGFLQDVQAHALAGCDDLSLLSALARRRRTHETGAVVTWSPKVFLPLTQLCRDVCHYCTFAQTPNRLAKAYLSVDEVLNTVVHGKKLGCLEALFTLGDRPEARWPQARDALAALGFASTIDYLVHVAGRVLSETGTLPHINAGVLDEAEIARLRPVSASMGLMLECVSERLCAPGMPHHGSPDKHPARRFATLEAAGRAKVPFTSGILIGIGETRTERIDSLLALRASHLRHGHLQEVIVQDFHPKPGTKMAGVSAPSLTELCWTIAVARLILPPEVTVQAPPNLNPGHLDALLDAGINDFGGVSPLTRDFVNPEAPWPDLSTLQEACLGAGLVLQPRLTIHPRFARDAATWVDAAVAPLVRRLSDADGLGRDETWRAGQPESPPSRWTVPLLQSRPIVVRRDTGFDGLLAQAVEGHSLDEPSLVRLLRARGDEVLAVCHAADQSTRQLHGDRVSYVVTRNINYTNRCTYGCTFCAFSRPARQGPDGGTRRGGGDAPYRLSFDEIAERAQQAWRRGATEVCLQGGIHPRFDGHTYLDIVAAVREAAPQIHIHAFSPLEVWHGAQTLGLSLETYLAKLRNAGLNSLPGTAAEILDDGVRAVLCPDKVNTQQWLDVMRVAHGVGLRSTATMMFGHVDAPQHWARHLSLIRSLQLGTGGFTEFVPLPFVAAETPIFRRGRARPGPTFREVLLVHAVARLALQGAVPNIQVSWVKLGEEGAAACLRAGANDLGGTLMDESITRAAGAVHGQEMASSRMSGIAARVARLAWQRTTFYDAAAPERSEAARADEVGRIGQPAVSVRPTGRLPIELIGIN